MCIRQAARAFGLVAEDHPEDAAVFAAAGLRAEEIRNVKSTTWPFTSIAASCGTEYCGISLTMAGTLRYAIKTPSSPPDTAKWPSQVNHRACGISHQCLAGEI